jgi:hypothetical protein
MKRKKQRKAHELVKVEVVIDESAAGSLMLVERLSEIGEIQNHGDGIFTVDQVTEQAVLDVCDEFPQAVMKSEVV